METSLKDQIEKERDQLDFIQDQLQGFCKDFASPRVGYLMLAAELTGLAVQAIETFQEIQAETLDNSVDTE